MFILNTGTECHETTRRLLIVKLNKSMMPVISSRHYICMPLQSNILNKINVYIPADYILFEQKVLLIFLFFHKNIHCEYSLEVPH